MSSTTVQAPSSVERFFQFSILGLLTSGFLAVAGSGRLDAAVIAVTAAGLVLRALMVFGLVRFTLSQTAVTVLTLAYIAFFPLDFLYISREFLPATVHMIFFLAVIRILTARTRRDYFFVKAIAFMELLAAAVLSTNSSFFFFLVLFVIFGVATFASSEVRQSSMAQQRTTRVSLHHFPLRLGALTTTAAMGIVIMTAGLFFLLPRTARAALRHLIPQRYHIAGFSSEVTLGQTGGDIKLSSTPVMHIKVDGDGLPHAFKWRGTALSTFDGRRWYNPPEHPTQVRVLGGFARLVDYKQQWRRGRLIQYEVRIQALDSDNLFFTGVPESVRIDTPFILHNSTDSWRTGMGLSDGLDYIAFSHLDREGIAASYQSDAMDPAQLETYTHLPEVDSRIGVLARHVTSHARSEFEQARAIERHLRTEYGYTTTLPETASTDPLANFLFERKKGHCEYFASAMAVMLRTLHIPARVVTGFQSGIYNDITGWQVIRAGDAHSWVEAYIQNRGWTTFDPTPSDTGAGAAVVTSKLMLYVDTLETFWQDWVLDYNQDRQLRLAAQMQQSGHGWNLTWATQAMSSVGALISGNSVMNYRGGMPLFGAVATVVVAVVFAPWIAAWLRRQRRVRRMSRGLILPNDAAILYDRMLAILRRRGVEKPAWLTPLEFASVIPLTASTDLVCEITKAYNELRFGGSTQAGQRIVSLLHELESVSR